MTDGLASTADIESLRHLGALVKPLIYCISTTDIMFGVTGTFVSTIKSCASKEYSSLIDHYTQYFQPPLPINLGPEETAILMFLAGLVHILIGTVLWHGAETSKGICHLWMKIVGIVTLFTLSGIPLRFIEMFIVFEYSAKLNVMGESPLDLQLSSALDALAEATRPAVGSSEIIQQASNILQSHGETNNIIAPCPKSEIRGKEE